MDHSAAIKKYVAHVDEAAMNGLLKTYALVLSKSDAAVVALSDEAERQTVKTNFLTKKLGLSLSEAEMDKALDEVAAQMKGDNHKSRAAVYYLLAEKFGKLEMFK